MLEKVKNAQKAAMSVKLISSTHTVLSGRLGELFIIDGLSCPDVIVIKAHSLEDIPSYL